MAGLAAESGPLGAGSNGMRVYKRSRPLAREREEGADKRRKRSRGRHKRPRVGDGRAQLGMEIHTTRLHNYVSMSLHDGDVPDAYG